MKHWMFSCKEVTQMVSESMDRDLPRYQRIEIWIHLMMCKFCSRYRQQLMSLRKVLRPQALHAENNEPHAKLSPEARKRIKKSLHRNDLEIETTKDL
ncbi:MAG TPA: hypothetical protein ENI07_22140 [Desulfobacterales bacterium]|nr:hypothetical protein [Desulfobacterales bacterium]